jgi:hypothetical protein
MVHGIKGVLDVQVQENYRMLGVALVFKETLQLEELTLRAAAFAKCLLCIVQELVPFHEAGHPLVNNVEENDEFCADARNRPEFCKFQGRLLFREGCDESPHPLGMTNGRVLASQEGIYGRP